MIEKIIYKEKEENVELFGQKIYEGYFEKRVDGVKIEYKVEKIIWGYKVSGKVKGRAERINVLSTEKPKEGLYLNNWQSWGLFLREDEFSKVVEGYKKRRIGIYTYTPMPDLFNKVAMSDYFILGPDLLLGFLTSKIAHPYFIVKNGYIEAWLEYFDTEFPEYIPIEPFVILKDLPQELLLTKYADLVKIENEIKIMKKDPTGWSSWYQYYLDLKWDDVLHNLELSKKMNMPYELFQIDDGYEKNIGEWLSAKEGFPDISDIAETIKSYGYTAGIWTAPLSIGETSEIYKAHKDWLVSENGKPKPAYYNWDRNIFALDITNNDAKNWLYEIFTTLKRAGFEYFKIDFMFAGALPGTRKENITPIQAYRWALSIIKEAVGDSFILGCGAPLLPSLGLVDGMRIGPDTAPFWKKDEEQGDINAYWALKNTITRWFMHKRWWLNDPDCLLLRPEDTKLTPSQRELYGIVSGILDNMIIESDNLSYIKEEEINLLNKVLAYRGGRPKVEFLGDDQFIISTEGSKRGNIKILVNLDMDPFLYKNDKIPPFSYKILEDDEKGLKLTKKPIKREDGRTFIYYEGDN